MGNEERRAYRLLFLDRSRNIGFDWISRRFIGWRSGEAYCLALSHSLRFIVFFASPVVQKKPALSSSIRVSYRAYSNIVLKQNLLVKLLVLLLPFQLKGQPAFQQPQTLLEQKGEW